MYTNTLQTPRVSGGMLSVMSTESRIAANPSDSLEAIMKKYQRRLYLYALQILHNHEDAEEAVQDAFLRAHRAWTQHNVKRPKSGWLKAWFFKITLNVVRNRLRRKRLSQISLEQLNDSDTSHSALENHSSPDVIVDRYATADLIECAIRALPSHLIEAARLRFIEGLSHSEIAVQCSQPEGTIKAKVFRARLLLRRVLEPAFV